MKSYYDIRAAAGQDAAEILLYDYIGGMDWNTGKVLDGKTFAADLKALGDVATLDIRIHSPGGNVFEGNAIINIIDRHPARKVVHIDGLAASMASGIAMVGDEIRMAENALFMIHNPYTVMMGDAAEMRRTADYLDKVRDTLIGNYQRHANLTRDEIVAAMDAETWYSAEEARDAGFVDAIEPARAIAACVVTPAMAFRHLPAAAAALIEVSDVHAEPLARPAGHSLPAARTPVLTPDTAGNSPNRKPKGDSMSSIFDRLLRGLGFKPADGETDEQAEARLQQLTATFSDAATVRMHFDAGRDVAGAVDHLISQHQAQLAEVTARADQAAADLVTAQAAVAEATAKAEAAEAARAKLAAQVKDHPSVVITGAQNQGTPEEQWEASDELQREFSSARAYAAYARRHANKREG